MTNRATRVAPVAALFYLVAPLTLASIYRCSDEQGVLLFSQYPCASADSFETMVITPINVVAAARLTKSEQATLDRIQRQFHRNTADSLRDRQRARRRIEHRRTERIALCARTREALKRLRKRRRSGYSLTTVRALDAEEADLKAGVSENC